MRAAERGRIGAGLALIERACAAMPRDAEAHAQHARWLSKLHRHDEALAAATRAAALASTDARTDDTLGVVYSRAGRHQLAVERFSRATQAEPGRAGFQFNLASSLKFLGRFDEAEAAYESCLAADPRYWRAHSALSQLRRQSAERNHLGRLEALLAAGVPDADAELHLRHALARELEDLGRHAEAFDHLLHGKRRRRRERPYDFERDRSLFDAAQRLYPSPLEPVPTAADDGPIFVVGMPRTGTTLVDRILSSHSRVSSAGESQNFGVQVKRATGTLSPRVLDEETLLRSAHVDLAVVGRQYLDRTRPPGDAPRFVDKLPLNFFYLGHVARALPQARLVVVRRNPLDTVLANFRQLFALNLPYYDYSGDLVDTARYYAAFDGLVAHWRRVLPGRVHELSYEALVDEPRGVIAALLEHCGLAWQEACVDFQRNPAAVATASAVQVREPLHAEAVGRWRRYERELQPAIAALRSLGIES